MSQEKLKVIADWVESAFIRTGNRFNMNKSTKECFDIAKAYLSSLELVSVEKLALLLKQAEEHYNFDSDIPSASQIKGFIGVRRLAEKQKEIDAENYQLKYSKSSWAMVMEASRWQASGMHRNGLNERILKGIGLIIGDIEHFQIKQSMLNFYEKICGCQIQLFTEGMNSGV